MHISWRSFPVGGLSLLIAVLATALVLVTMPDYGLSADEAFYMSIGRANATWLRQPSWNTIDEYWPIHDRHPPLLKISGGITWYMFSQLFPVLPAISAFRLGVLPFVFLLSGVMTWYTAKMYGRVLGCFAGLSVILLPRVFFHAHLGALDFPITALWFTTAAVAVFAVRQVRFFIPMLLLLGAALATKLQGAFLGMTVGGYVTLTGLAGLFRGKVSFRTVVPFVCRTLLLVAVPLTVFFCLWPYLWPEPWARFQHYTKLMLDHYPIETFYLGKTYTNNPGDTVPWHYPFVLLLATVPLGVVLPAGIGLVSAALKPRRHERFMALNLFVPLIMMALPQAIRYDGERLFLPAYPFAVLMAVVGLARVRLLLGRAARWFPLLVAGLALYVTVTSLRIHPYQFAYANELVGGIPGSLARGFETEYWGTSYKAVLPFLAEHRTATFCVFPWPDLVKGYPFQGLTDVEVTLVDQASVYAGNFGSCQYLVMLARQGFFYVNPVFWEYYRYKAPVFAESVDGVPLVLIYAVQ